MVISSFLHSYKPLHWAINYSPASFYEFIYLFLFGEARSMAPHSSTLAWKIPWMEEPGRLQSMGSLRVGHDWATSLSLFTFMHWRRKWQPTLVFLPGKSQGWWSLAGCHLWGHTGSDTTEVTWQQQVRPHSFRKSTLIVPPLSALLGTLPCQHQQCLYSLHGSYWLPRSTDWIHVLSVWINRFCWFCLWAISQMCPHLLFPTVIAPGKALITAPMDHPN